MAFAKISQVAHYAPEQIITNEDLAQVMDTSDEWISSRTGIKERHISKTESTGDLATEVAIQLLEKAGISAEELDFIIIATMTPDSMMPSTAARVQAKIGAHKAFAYDLTAACSGFVLPYQLQKSSFLQEHIERVWLSVVRPCQNLWIGLTAQQLSCSEMELVVYYLRQVTKNIS